MLLLGWGGGGQEKQQVRAIISQLGAIHSDILIFFQVQPLW